MELKRHEILKLIDEVMERKDKDVIIFISEVGTTIRIEPHKKEKDPEWIRNVIPVGTKFATSEYVCPICGRCERNHTPYCPQCGEKLKMPSKEDTDVDN